MGIMSGKLEYALTEVRKYFFRSYFWVNWIDDLMRVNWIDDLMREAPWSSCHDCPTKLTLAAEDSLRRQDCRSQTE